MALGNRGGKRHNKSVISVIIPTLNDAARLPRTLAPLVLGVAEGLVKQAIIANGPSTDDTAAVAEAAGCDVIEAGAKRGQQLRAGARAAKGIWLLFLRAGAELAEGWLGETRRFVEGDRNCAAAFRLATTDASARSVQVLRALMKRPLAEQGLLISRALYEKVGGYHDMDSAHEDLIRRIGARRLIILRAAIGFSD